MNRWIAAAALVCGLVPMARAEDVGDPLAGVARELGGGADRFARGDAAADSWKPWEARVAPDLEKELHAKLAGSSSSAVAIDLVLVHLKSGKPVYVVRAGFLASSGEVRVVALEGKADDKASPGRPLADWRGAAQPFQDTARALVKAIEANDKALGFADATWIGALKAPDDARARWTASADRGRRNLANMAGVVGAKGADEVRLRVDGFSVVLDKGLLGGSLILDDGKLVVSGLALSAAPAAPAPKAGADWYPKDITPPAGTKYPCALTALPRDLPGIPVGDRLFVNHTYSMILKVTQAKLVVLKHLEGPKSGYDVALAAYLKETKAALEKIKAEPVPDGLKDFQADVVSAIELLDAFFKEATAVRKAGKPWDDMWKIPVGREASSKLLSAWSKMQARYPSWSAETKDSIYHHLCALDLF